SQPITVGFTPSQVVGTGVGTATTVTGTPITVLQDLGTSLLITPNINNDRTVTLRILQENSSVVPNGGKIPVPNTSGAVTQVPVDTVARQTLTGTIVAKDGLTIAVGGLIQESVNDVREEIPILGKIPYLGFLFRRQDTRRSRNELVILIRPYVMTTPVESSGQSKALTETLSIHPNIVGENLGTLGTYNPQEVLRPNPPATELQKIFRVYTIIPKDF